MGILLKTPSGTNSPNPSLVFLFLKTVPLFVCHLAFRTHDCATALHRRKPEGKAEEECGRKPLDRQEGLMEKGLELHLSWVFSKAFLEVNMVSKSLCLVYKRSILV